MRRALALLFFCLCAAARAAPVAVTDDAGNHLTLPGPAQRIVSLAPHVTELLFAAGAGSKVVGAVEYSDYPEAAKAIPRVGDNQRLDLERILALHPDLIVVWRHGNAQGQLEQLHRLGLPMFYSQPGKLADIGPAVEVLGRLAGTDAVAAQAARQYDERLARLTKENLGKAPLKVFFQIWDQPLMTVNGTQLISDAIRTCGGQNVFGALPALVPTVDIEAVLAADPQVIVATGADASRPPWLDDWKRWQHMAAVHRNNLFYLPPDSITRLAPRVLDGVEMLCRQFDEARAKP